MREHKNITLRKAVLDDMANIFKWRNAPEVRNYSLNKDPIPWETHSDWFPRILQSDQHHLLIAEIAGSPLGVLRYDVHGVEAEVSIFLLSAMQGKGYGSSLLTIGNEWVKKNLPFIQAIQAKILPDNLISQKVFAKAGFTNQFSVYMYSIVKEVSE